MGTYLSTPVTEKASEVGEILDCEIPVRWAVVDMQGWRKSMEDAHIAQTSGLESETLKNAKLFGVFDGHGGPEVARFCQLYMLSVLKKQEKLWKNISLDEAAGDMGLALIETFHGLDRMIDDPERREELIRLRTIKPPFEERRETLEIPPPGGIGLAATTLPLGTVAPPPNADSAIQQELSLQPPPPPPPPQSRSDNEVADSRTQPLETDSLLPEKSAADAEAISAKATDAVDTEIKIEAEESKQEKREDDGTKGGQGENDDEDEYYDSDEALGQEEAAAEREQDTASEESTDIEINPYDGNETPNNSPSGKVSFMFQRLLNIAPSGQVVGRAGEEDGEKSPEDTNNPAESPSPNPAAQVTGPSVLRPTLVQNGRLICNLPDHPIHAGCTAVVALLVGNILTVANAGDSRAVLCRAGGLTEPLSFDHKPQQLREMTRIKNAGGFVNQFGRVNGNLNLSRSIGDLKYKQVPGITPADQMITAEPDIIQVRLEPEDEFIVLGCDGIWDCLTNEKAVQYVRDRIDFTSPKQIGVEMLDEIISDDPKATQGIGGDNMTIMILDLQPASRNYNNTLQPALSSGSGSEQAP